MHKYIPRVHIVRADDLMKVNFCEFVTFSFKESEFIAVTAYQNEQVSSQFRQLKTIRVILCDRWARILSQGATRDYVGGPSVIHHFRMATLDGGRWEYSS